MARAAWAAITIILLIRPAQSLRVRTAACGGRKSCTVLCAGRPPLYMWAKLLRVLRARGFK